MDTIFVACLLIIASSASWTLAFYIPPKNILPKTCGISDPTRIVGGTEAEPRAWPWMVSLRYFWDAHFCGGFLVTRSHVITAAHCVSFFREIHSFMTIAAGISISAGGVNTLARAKVKSIFIHPQFNKQSAFDSDIAIVVLQNPLQFDLTISAACLPTKELTERQKVLAIGYGKIGEGIRGFSPLLRQVEIEVLDPKNCGSYHDMIEGTMICAGVLEGGKDACGGDSGGPLMAEAEDGIWEAVGIVSFGEGCGRPNKPGAYINVFKFVPWILNTIWKNI